MRFLIIDRDRLSAQILQTRLDELGFDAIVEPTKNMALDRLKTEDFTAIFVDPAPLNDVRPVVLGIRRATEGRSLPYIFLMTKEYSEGEKKWGVNDFILKPVDNEELDNKLANATRLKEIIDHLGDTKQDTLNTPHVLGKMGFNQVFLSALDRADRYDEAASLITIKVDNLESIMVTEGPEALGYINKVLAKKLAKLKRQSDLLGHIAACEYAFLIQRPVFDSEPVDAANRFAETMRLFDDLKSQAGELLHIKITVYGLPTGNIMHDVTAAYTGDL